MPAPPEDGSAAAGAGHPAGGRTPRARAGAASTRPDLGGDAPATGRPVAPSTRPTRTDDGPTGDRGAAADDRPDAAPATDGGSGAREVFQYAVLRLVPSVARGEGLNVGVVLHARRHRFLGLRTVLDHERLLALDPTLDLAALEEHLSGLVRVADGDDGAGAIAAMPRSDRFGWLSAPSNTMVQPSPVHTGLCADASATLERLVAELVTVGG
ncbi:DUF3037 domain-containing protein [Patulibacter sp.]|uniref:DUF3037 domain-containing protein n=1 Tax=Patulibacter sp. TaxID=1912859 RepID=UPI00272818CB|nr:DUF3037 domain-containing protein [Patulibacter sp.]MDO9410323.1 DUF3037 domain-containing protein [Patulibacter sp.]